VFRFEWSASSVRSVVTIIPSFADRQLTTPTTKITKLTKDAQRLLWGHLTHYPIIKAHDNPLIAAGLLVGCLWRGRAALRGRASHRSAARARGAASACSCADGEAGRADYEVGARPDRRENPDDRKDIDPGKILYIIMSNSTSRYRLGNDLLAIQVVNEAIRCRKLFPSRLPNAT